MLTSAGAATGTRRDWLGLLGVAAGYAVAFVIARRALPFSVESPWFVCLAMICFLGLASMARRVVRLRMPGALRRVRGWEADGRVYRRLAVPAFGTLLRRTPLRFLNGDVYLAAGGRRSGLSGQLEAAETSHFWAAVLVVPYMMRLSLVHSWDALFWVTVAQVLWNVYPVLHLRFVRGRLDRVAARRARGRAMH